MNKLLKLLLFFICLTLNVHGQTYNKTTNEEQTAKDILKSALTDTIQYNHINSKYVILKDTAQAIKFAEQILFKIYGKKLIKNEKPYSVYYIDNYWIMWGYLPENVEGGSFLIIIASQGGKIIRITHGQ